MAIVSAFKEFALAKAQTGIMVTDEAVFSATESDGELVTVYFTPTTEVLAHQFQAVACEKPVPVSRKFSLLAGDQRAWEAHFPEYLEKKFSD